MSFKDLKAKIATDTGLTQAAVDRVITALTAEISNELKAGNKVSIPGFGTFSIKERAARTGRNPKTGEQIEIKASKSPHFAATPSLKDAVQ